NCDLVVVAVIHFGETGAIDCELGGTALTLATDDNPYVKIFYRLNPAAGAQTLDFELNQISSVVCAQYSDIESFQSAQQASAGSANYSPSGAGLIVHAISATSAGTPVADTNERFDGGTGEWYGDRIVTGAGTVNVGATISDPDYAGAIFLAPSEEPEEVDASGTPTAAAPTASGSASVVVSSSGASTAAAPTASGSASPVVASSGAVSGPAPSASGAASAVVSAAGTLSALTPGASGSSSAVVGASGAPSAAPPTATGAAEGEAVDPAASGSVSAPAPGAAGSASVDVAASGSTVAAAPSASAGLGVVVSASGATDAIAPGAAGSSSVVVGASGAVAAAQPIASG